jgi:uncharacterized protein (TIGR00375 family)
MKVIADLHLHSFYSRATSREMNLEGLSRGAKAKGLNLLGSSDFTFDAWLGELKRKLEPIEGSGLFKYDKIYWMLSTEVSTVYQLENKLRKVHHLIYVPSFDIAEQINERLSKYGNLSSDGRPTLRATSPELVETVMSVSKDAFIVPAHLWTSWFGALGEYSGFNSLEECYQEQVKHIYAFETGMSSDPAMNWRLKILDKFTPISNSDSHSPWSHRLGREANVFELEDINYWEIIDAIKKRDKNRFLFTIETPPEYGKYHWDGHRNCKVFLNPKEAIKLNNICPVCGKKLTIGVLHRVEELADRPEGFVPEDAIPFRSLIPLSELIAAVYNVEVFSRKVWEESTKLIKEFGSELNVLLEVPEYKLRLLVNERIVDLIMKNREGKIKLQPGYDGEYGYPLVDGDSTKKSAKLQRNLREF